MIEEGELTEEAKELIEIGKDLEQEGYELSKGLGPKRKINRELVLRLIHARNKKSTKNKIEMEFLRKIFKNILKSAKSRKSKVRNKNEYGINSKDFLEKELARAIIGLRSANTADSDVNDLRILEDMAKITMLVSALSGKGSRSIDMAQRSINNVSFTVRGASLQNAVSMQALKVNTESMDQALRYHLDKASASIDISSLPTTEEAKIEKERANKKFSDSVQAVRFREDR